MEWEHHQVTEKLAFGGEKLFSNVKFLSQREKNQKKKRETESIEFEENNLEIYLLEYNA